MEGIDEKISGIINHFNLNNFSFSKRIGVTGTTIDSIVNGRPQSDGSRKKTKPGYDVLSAIIEEFDINPDYLFGKSDVMLKSEAAINPTYSGMPQVIAVNQTGNENVIYVPVKARAGYLNGYGDPEYIETLPSFNMPHLTNGTFRCFEVKGNSMVRTFFDGDLVFGKYVEDLRDIKDGRVYVIVSKNDGIVLKRVINRIEQRGKLILKSDNKDGNYPTYTINTEDIVEVWYVTMYASKQMPEPVDIYDRLHELESKVVDLEGALQGKLLK
ncbi:LexA family transcriptional regulator [Winogradskyella sp. SYSU M77433]|uniref:LexA family transcriptional regulator n=1 Tax=Winogradskyella sp. SYSU M77433 TaxID=3042722 RepID=UPI0024802CD5|nr:LexA family transcriptional regulator [Winogradskyella sp. SYSU M77433]MDH7913759.1 LexA family transcriptional regulator [Winogradskyella sp. SYSU M77433]